MLRLQNILDQYDLQDFVTLLGKRSQDTLPYYYSAAEVVVVPSHYESFGMVALEAMACGIPVVASDVGGLAYLVQDGKTGFTVPVADPEALASKLSLIINNGDLHAKMSMQAAEYAQQYSWTNIVDRLLDVYDEVLTNHKKQ